MAPRLRRVLRLLRPLRVLVACLALGVLASPAPAAAPSLVDSVAWTAGARAAAEAESRAGDHAAPPCHLARPIPPVGLRLRDRAAPPLPAGALAVVVQHRVYLRHAALLC